MLNNVLKLGLKHREPTSSKFFPVLLQKHFTKTSSRILRSRELQKQKSSVLLYGII